MRRDDCRPVVATHVEVGPHAARTFAEALHQNPHRQFGTPVDRAELRRFPLVERRAQHGGPEGRFGVVGFVRRIDADLVDPAAGAVRLAVRARHPLRRVIDEAEDQPAGGPQHPVAVVGELPGPRCDRLLGGGSNVAHVHVEVQPRHGIADALRFQHRVTGGGLQGDELTVPAAGRRPGGRRHGRPERGRCVEAGSRQVEERRQPERTHVGIAHSRSL